HARSDWGGTQHTDRSAHLSKNRPEPSHDRQPSACFYRDLRTKPDQSGDTAVARGDWYVRDWCGYGWHLPAKPGGKHGDHPIVQTERSQHALQRATADGRRYWRGDYEYRALGYRHLHHRFGWR